MKNEIITESAPAGQQTGETKMKFKCNGYPDVVAESMSEAARIFAARAGRREFGNRAGVRTCVRQSYAQDGSLAEYSAFIGLTRGSETTGRNINFTVFAS